MTASLTKLSNFHKVVIRRVINNLYFLLVRMVLTIMSQKAVNIEIQVTGNLERSLKQFKKKIEREGVSRDIKRQVYFEPPTQKRRKRLMRAVKNNLIKMYESSLI